MCVVANGVAPKLLFNGTGGSAPLQRAMTNKITRQKETAAGAGEYRDPAARPFRCGRQEVDSQRQEARLRHHDQINVLLSSEEVKSEQIENILARLSELGINVVRDRGGRA